MGTFQFHIGSIKSVIEEANELTTNYRFNSTLVRLKEKNDPKLEYKESGFNSTLVRLKARGDGRVCWGNSWFQFHIGSIKRLS